MVQVIVDASAVLAIVFDESDADRFAAQIVNAPSLKMSAVNFLEAAVRIDALRDSKTAEIFDRTMSRSGIEVVEATSAHAATAREVYRKFGKGYHEARLNLADCFAYALALETGEPLLFKGDDFKRTDIPSAL